MNLFKVIKEDTRVVSFSIALWINTCWSTYFKVSSEDTKATYKEVVFYGDVSKCFSLTWNSIKSSALGVNHPVKYKPFPTNDEIFCKRTGSMAFWVNHPTLWKNTHLQKLSSPGS